MEFFLNSEKDILLLPQRAGPHSGQASGLPLSHIWDANCCRSKTPEPSLPTLAGVFSQQQASGLH